MQALRSTAQRVGGLGVIVGWSRRVATGPGGCGIPAAGHGSLTGCHMWQAISNFAFFLRYFVFFCTFSSDPARKVPRP